MNIISLSLKNFRCFQALELEFSAPFTLITGPNGSGKTSLLEALHYACYLRSFKTFYTKELIYFDREGFLMKLALAHSGYDIDLMHITFAHHKREVRLNQKQLGSHKELYARYKAVTITEDDLDLVQGAPALRRAFLDTMLSMIDPEYAQVLRKYKIVVDNRNALLAKFSGDYESYVLWTDQLLKLSVYIQEKRIAALNNINLTLSTLVHTIGEPNLAVTLKYIYGRKAPMGNIISGASILEQQPSLVTQELAYRRSLFGAHVDDFEIICMGKQARVYASRGQQKLIVFLLKIGQAQLIVSSKATGGLPEETDLTFLVDDFMTDFDERKVDMLLPLLSTYGRQVIMTCPTSQGYLQEQLLDRNAQLICLPIVNK